MPNKRLLFISQKLQLPPGLSTLYLFLYILFSGIGRPIMWVKSLFLVIEDFFMILTKKRSTTQNELFNETAWFAVIQNLNL